MPADAITPVVIPTLFEDEKLIWTVDALMSASQCNELIGRTSTLRTSGGGNVDYRDQDRFVFDDRPMAASLLARLRPHLPEQMGPLRLEGLNTRFRLYRYRVGQRFMLHTDHWYAPSTTSITLHTVLFYLNDGFQGGTTSFPGQPTSVIEPRTGRCAIFQHKLHHSGDEVLRGVKYLLRTDTIYCSEGADIKVDGGVPSGHAAI